MNTYLDTSIGGSDFNHFFNVVNNAIGHRFKTGSNIISWGLVSTSNIGKDGWDIPRNLQLPESYFVFFVIVPGGAKIDVLWFFFLLEA